MPVLTRQQAVLVVDMYVFSGIFPCRVQESTLKTSACFPSQLNERIFIALMTSYRKSQASRKGSK